jgi:hypothetical protein
MKPNCFNNSIPRGKYCEIHRTNRRVIEERNRIDERRILEEMQRQIIEETKKTEQRRIIEERQKIMDEQEKEYHETMMKDIKRIEDEERRKIDEEEKKNLKENEMDSLRQQIFSYEMNDKSFMIRFVLNNNNDKISHFFKHDATFKNIFDYIDLYIYDNNIKLENYYLVCYPNLVYTRQNTTDKLENHFNYKKINLFIKFEEE